MDMASPSPFNVSGQINAVSSGKNKTHNESSMDYEGFILAGLTMFFCVLGILGNGLVIWLLGSSVKKNTFAIYFLNLSVADFGLLIIVLIIKIHWYHELHYDNNLIYEFFEMVLLLMYSTGQFFLTVISIDRCVSVLFPIWYRCHRPVHLFIIVCAVIWAISFILSSIYFIIVAVDADEQTYTLVYPFIINAVLCLPLMTISSVILLIKICFTSKSQRWRKLLTIILLTLFFFLVFAFPLNIFLLILNFVNYTPPNILSYGYVCTCINSSVNPLIYYLVGRQKSKSQRSIKDLLQRVFKEEENCTDQTSEGSKI